LRSHCSNIPFFPHFSCWDVFIRPNLFFRYFGQDEEVLLAAMMYSVTPSIPLFTFLDLLFFHLVHGSEEEGLIPFDFGFSSRRDTIVDLF